VARIGGADELVVRDAEFLPCILERRCQIVDEGLRSLVGLGGGADHLDAVLVRSGQEIGRFTALAVITGQAVGEHLLVRVAEVRPAVHVVDRGGDVEATWHGTPEKSQGIINQHWKGVGSAPVRFRRGSGPGFDAWALAAILQAPVLPPSRCSQAAGSPDFCSCL
jgi:hypothetical protein